jgi:hypothetical protein
LEIAQVNANQNLSLKFLILLKTPMTLNYLKQSFFKLQTLNNNSYKPKNIKQ